MPSPIVIVNPATGERLREVPCDDPASVDAKLEAARRARKRWRERPLEQRIAALLQALEYFRAHREAVARDVTLEVGKPIAQARHEVDTLLARAEYLLEVAPEALAAEHPRSPPGFELRIEHEPLGLVLDIAAWNYPLIVPIGVVVSALAAGDAVVLKHSPKSPSAGLHYERAFGSLPEPVFANVVVPDERAGALVEDPRVAHVAFTGSVATGRRVAEAAGRSLKSVGLELGGKDPAYVADDADLDFAAENLVDGACYNAGQSCCAIERVYVHEKVVEPFLERVVRALAAYRLGDPLDEATTLGPLVDAAALARVEAHVADAVRRGARVVRGAKRPAGRGFFHEPTLLAECPDESDAMREETFGPLVPVRAVRDDEEALARMNDSRYGLTASVWTRDAARTERFARALETGTVFQNRCDYLDPSLPWTGVKESGFGSTLSRYGFLYLTRRKSLHFRR
jgi:acyl-CoA reductase-like NAD-dependent aldehyde dehydrogenase